MAPLVDKVEPLPKGKYEIKYGDQMLDEVIAEPTMDRYLDRSPKLNEPKDYVQLVSILRKKRELFIKAEDDKKSGVKPEEKTDED